MLKSTRSTTSASPQVTNEADAAEADAAEQQSGPDWPAIWEDSKGMLLVLLSEMFGAGMAASTRLLQLGDADRGREGMSTLQILFARFSITLVLSSLYMWWARVPEFPFGLPAVRWLLVLRGIAGFLGCYGFYYSLRYLPLSEAIVIFFLTPLMTSYASSLFLHEPFSRRQLLAGLMSLVGIGIIANPFTATTTHEHVSTFQRLLAIGFGLFSDVAATAAFTLIRHIGDRAHPLISVNYYAACTTVLTTVILALPIIPGEDFRLPKGRREWGLLVAIGICGFMLQTLLTMGLLKDKSAKATNMMYVQVVFGLILDWSIWGVVPGWGSAIGGSIVVGSTLWGVLQGKSQKVARKTDEEYAPLATDEFLDGGDDEGSEEE